MSLSRPRQVKRMQDKWPRFQVVEQARQFVCWEGPLQPLSQQHDIRISLFRERGRGRGSYRLSPQVIVLNPALHHRKDDPNKAQMMGGGLLAWRRIIETAMSLQSQNALGQAGLLLGAKRLMRLDAPTAGRSIELDDWKRSVAELVPAAEQMLEEQGYAVAEMFLSAPTEAYRPQGMPATLAVGA